MKNGGCAKMKVYQSYYTRSVISKAKNAYFLFGDNAADAKTGYIPSQTQAVIRGLPNAIGVITKLNRGTLDSSYLNDSYFDRYKDYIDSVMQQVQDLIAKGYDVYVPKDGIGTGKAELFKRAPKCYAYLDSQGLIPHLPTSGPEAPAFLENPGFSLTDGQKTYYHKSFDAKTPWLSIVSEYRKNTRFYGDMAYPELIERARRYFAPYKAFMITKDYQDESNVAQYFTEDSQILVIHSEFVEGKWYNEEKLMSRDEYINMKYEELCGFTQPYIHDEDWLYNLDVDTARYDIETVHLNVREPDMKEYILGIKSYSTKFYTPEDHFDLDSDSTSELIEFEYGHTPSNKTYAKLSRSNVSREEFKQKLEINRAWREWIESLHRQGKHDLANEVLALHENIDIKVCECCRHKYSNDLAKCPICHVENETCHFDLEDRNPNWFGYDEFGNLVYNSGREGNEYD